MSSTAFPSLGIKADTPVSAKIKSNFIKKKNYTRFIKGKLSFSNKGQAEFEIFKGQESYKIKSFIKANTWCLFKSGKSTFKKGDLIECFNLLGGQ